MLKISPISLYKIKYLLFLQKKKILQNNTKTLKRWRKGQARKRQNVGFETTNFQF